MGRKLKIEEPVSRYAINRARFQAIESHWGTIRMGYLKSIEGEVKAEIESIYREELDPKWLPNRYCSGCYFNAVKDLIHHFIL